ncbi:hypothetical protein [Winogradskyella sp.]|uniref:hypothetical protein n=1 Tax=Winogradskyella sp. TaxID=1883156 RepID=UPI00260D283A|nr:hypothetical protein [Winogradskyella sp.]
MKKDILDDLFENLKGEFDINEPNEGHEHRFLDKLKASTDTKNSSGINWKPFLAVAASLVICFSVFTTINSDQEVVDLASVSPELSETQDFFTATIETELKKLNQERSPLTQKMISDALEYIESLEKEYENLKISLTENGNDQRIIYAMINNFQSRIDILNNVLDEIEKLKQLNINTDETTNTI